MYLLLTIQGPDQRTYLSELIASGLLMPFGPISNDDGEPALPHTMTDLPTLFQTIHRTFVSNPDSRHSRPIL